MSYKNPPSKNVVWPLFPERSPRPLHVPIFAPLQESETAVIEAEIACELCESWQEVRQEIAELRRTDPMHFAGIAEDPLIWN